MIDDTKENNKENIKGNTEKIMKKTNEYMIHLDEKGHLILPDEVVGMLGMANNSSLRIVAHKNKIEIYPNIHSLAKIYIEPTNKCNLTCKTCIRETWDEPMGDMDINVFDKLVKQLKEFKTLQTVTFGGFGEPTIHKDILYMIGQIKSLGINVEMITNGTLLDDVMLKVLIENGLNTLWVSFDGTSSDNFDDIREGASFNAVVKNLKQLKELNKKRAHKIKIGIAFVVMKKNIHDLNNISKLAMDIEAKMVNISNVLPYNSEMLEQMVCDLSVRFNDQLFDSMSIPISIPLIDINNITKQPLYELFSNNRNISIIKNRIGTGTRSCGFIKERCTFIRWDGMVSPCMGLIHSYKTYFSVNGTEREVTSYTLGDVDKKNLKEVWGSQEYHDFRERVNLFDFSPCIQCGPCEFAEKNFEDCYMNKFPTCGGCLWAQGVIQCP